MSSSEMAVLAIYLIKVYSEKQKFIDCIINIIEISYCVSIVPNLLGTFKYYLEKIYDYKYKNIYV